MATERAELKHGLGFSYVIAKRAYQLACANFVEELIEQCRNPTDHIRQCALEAYGLEQAEEDFMEADDILRLTEGGLTQCVSELKTFVSFQKIPSNLEELQDDWQKKVHHGDVEVNRWARYIGGLTVAMKTTLAPLQQAALEAFIHYEGVFKPPANYCDENERPINKF